MNLKSYIKKLREAADVLESLFVNESNENATKAQSILKQIKKPKVHWTQRPENKHKLARLVKRMQRAKYENSKTK